MTDSLHIVHIITLSQFLLALFLAALAWVLSSVITNSVSDVYIPTLFKRLYHVKARWLNTSGHLPYQPGNTSSIPGASGKFEREPPTISALWLSCMHAFFHRQHIRMPIRNQRTKFKRETVIFSALHMWLIFMPFLIF